MMTQLLLGIDDLPFSETIELTRANFDQYTFIEYIPGMTGVVSQAGLAAIPHAVVLLRLPEHINANAVAQDIRSAVNPRRWICVEAEAARVIARGNYVVFAMSLDAVVEAVAENAENLM